MESFRWILAIAGALLLLGIYWRYLLERRFPHWFGKPPAAAQQAPQPATTDAVIYINLKSRHGLIIGADLLRAMEKFQLRHGEMGIFHRLQAGDQQPLFSIANMVEPGSFVIDKMANLETPGITILLQLSRTANPLHALDEMWATAQNLSRELNADILDKNHQPLSAQKQQNMRAEVLEYMRRTASAPG